MAKQFRPPSGAPDPHEFDRRFENTSDRMISESE
jgi:hypothetical protein